MLLYCIVLYYIILYHVILYYIMLYYIILYYITAILAQAIWAQDFKEGLPIPAGDPLSTHFARNPKSHSVALTQFGKFNTATGTLLRGVPESIDLPDDWAHFFGYSRTGNYTSDADSLARHRQGQGKGKGP